MIEKSVFPREDSALIKKLPPVHLNSAEKEEMLGSGTHKNAPADHSRAVTGAEALQAEILLLSCVLPGWANMMAEYDVLMGLFQPSSFYDNHKVKRDLKQSCRALKA